MKSRIIVLDKYFMKTLLVSSCYFFKLERSIYNVLCCVREITFPEISIQTFIVNVHTSEMHYRVMIRIKGQLFTRCGSLRISPEACHVSNANDKRDEFCDLLAVENDEIWQI
ncbi:hypothetical protein T10_4477 [Trichinella papuae]|uniref:Uncharacterized protein n=1 Tax=Trichinella papuae TaxID=268474 RepID=A0A0V1MHL8_9BILA|nr:hypothetical protein T10_4477 [Trichinella papuae]